MTIANFRLRYGQAFILVLALGLVSCDRKAGPKETPSDRGNLESDFSGKARVMLASGISGAEDSIKYAQYIYQMAACESEMYHLQNALIKAYIAACDEKCESHKCGDGDIVSAAMAYFLDGKIDSALAALSLRADGANRTKEVDEIAGIISDASMGAERLAGIFDSGKVRTPAAVAFMAVAAIDKGGPASEWTGRLKKIKSDLPDLVYARAYVLAAQGEVFEAWQTLPDYAPLSRSFPEPSFVEKIAIEGEDNQRKIYLPLGLYVRQRVGELLLARVLTWDYDQAYLSDISALKALARVKSLGEYHPDDLSAPLTGADPGSYGPKEELLTSLVLAGRGSVGAPGRLDSLTYPVSRAAFLDYLAARYPATDGLGPLVLAEIDSSRQRVIWESRILLSRALLEIAGPGQAFKILSNFGVSDLSVRNNSPEWLAIYARAGLEEASQLSLTSQVIYNLCQHYPHAIGLYELVQSYNHLCKYY